MHVFRAGGGEVASTHRSVAVLHPETQIVVPAYRLRAAGAEQEGLRNSVAALGERDARLAAHDEDVAAAHWLVAHETRIQAQEVLLCQRDLRPTADLEFEQITVGGIEQVIDRALDPRPVGGQRVAGARLAACGLDLLVLQAQRELGLDVAAHGGARGPHRLRIHLQPFEIAAFGERPEAVAMLAARRQEHVGIQRLAPLLHAQTGGELPAALAQVGVAVGKLDPRAGVGGKARAHAGVARQRLGHLHPHRHRRREHRITLDVDDHRAEVRRVLQVGLEGEQLLTIVGRARLQLAVALDEVGGQIFDALDLELTKIERGAAVDAHLQPRLRGLGVDLGATLGNPGGRIGARTHRVEQRRLGTIPCGLPERLPDREPPACAQQFEIRLPALAADGEIAGEGDVDRCDLGTQPGLHLQHPVRRIVPVKPDARRKIAFGGEQIGDLAPGAARHRHAIGLLLGQRQRVALEQADVLLEHRTHRIRRFETDRQRLLASGRGGGKRRGQGQQRTQPASAHRPLCQTAHQSQAPLW